MTAKINTLEPKNQIMEEDRSKKTQNKYIDVPSRDSPSHTGLATNLYLHVCLHSTVSSLFVWTPQTSNMEIFVSIHFLSKDNYLLSIWTNMSIQLVEICLFLNYQLLQTISLITLFRSLPGSLV